MARGSGAAWAVPVLVVAAMLVAAVYFIKSGRSIEKFGDTLGQEWRLETNQSVEGGNSYGQWGKLVMQADGNLVLYSDNRPIWSSNTWTPNPARNGYVLVMQKDGNLVVYNKDTWRATWSSGTWDWKWNNNGPNQYYEMRVHGRCFSVSKAYRNVGTTKLREFCG